MINIGIGISWVKALYSVAANIVANFRARVAADNGIFEAAPYLDVTLDELNAIGLLDKASLITTPNAYKESKLYSVVPSDGAGDMTVVRATTATRVNSAGLIEVVPRNLFTYSNTFSNAAWSKNTGAILSDNAISPEGILNASKLVGVALTTQQWLYRLSLPVVSGSQYTFSIFAKKGEYNFIQLRNLSSINSNSIFNLNTGTIHSTSTGTAQIQDFGNGWYKCLVTATATATGNSYIYVNLSTNGTSQQTFLGDGTSGLYIYGAQLENFATATEYFPTTTRLNIPRIDYSGGTASLLVEPQRTNLALYSEQFDNAAWNKSGSTITSNAAISPDGTTNADKLIDNITLVGHSLYSATSMVSGTTYTFSIFAKMSEIRYLALRYISGGAFSTNYITSFDLLNGTATNSATYPASSFLITSFGNGWYKCSISQAANATGTGTYAAYLSKDGVATTYTGNGTDGLYIYGAQLELGSYPTSYIPTVASTVTRNADVISKTGISSLIGQTEGVLFVEVDLTNAITGTTRRFMAIGDGTISNRIGLGLNTSNVIEGFVVASGSVQALITLATVTNQTYKIAIAYKANDVVLYVNGVQIGTDGSATIPAVANFYLMHEFGSDFPAANGIAQALLFPTRLTNAELILLTGDSFDTYNEMAEALNYTIQ